MREGISIITPAVSEFENLSELLDIFMSLDKKKFEWILIFDKVFNRNELDLEFFVNKLDKCDVITRINILESGHGAASCRMEGVKLASFNNFVFLDADDLILPNFINNRFDLKTDTFIIFKNFIFRNIDTMVSYNNSIYDSEKYLDLFLNAQFPFQTSCVIWNKSFFHKIGGFNKGFKYLEEIDLIIRAIKIADFWDVKDNPIDFNYLVQPISNKKRDIEGIIISIKELINLNLKYLTIEERRLLSGYFFLLVKYSYKMEDLNMNKLVNELYFFKKKKIVNNFQFVLFYFSSVLYNLRLFNSSYVLRVARKLFKRNF